MENNLYACSIERLQTEIHNGNIKAGWWDEVGEIISFKDITEALYASLTTNIVAAKMALMHSELSEALEGLRKDQMDDHLPHRKMVEVEFADAIIRILDTAEFMGLDVSGAIAEKLAYNAQRADHKRENRDKDGGKKI